jgi:hypothetical protein
VELLGPPLEQERLASFRALYAQLTHFLTPTETKVSTDFACQEIALATGSSMPLSAPVIIGTLSCRFVSASVSDASAHKLSEW